MFVKELNLEKTINTYLNSVKNVLDNLDRQEIEFFISILLNAYKADRYIFVMGNGGSGSTSSHLACDINKCISLGLENRFKVISLTDNMPIMLAHSNDTSYDNVFIEQLKNFLRPGDVVIGISGSGNSKNVIKAIEYANKNGAITVGFTGYNGGILKQICNHSINANIDDMQVTEDAHMVLVHLITRILNSIKLA